MNNFTQRLNRAYEQHLNFDFFGLDDEGDFWNFGYWLDGTRNQREAGENLMERLLAFVPKKRGKILDVACGKGATTRHLLKYYRPEQVTGINISEKQLQICRENAPGCTFIKMDATELKFPEASFDNMICVEAAVHFKTREKFLRAARRVLKPGGRLVMSDALLSVWSPSQPAENYLAGPAEYERMCRRAGFADVKVLDATEQCWGGLSRNIMRHVREKLRAGEIGLRDFYRGMSWVRRTDFSLRHYVLVSCTR